MWCLFGFCFFLKLTSYLEHFFTKILLGKNIIYSGVYQKNQQLNKRKRNTKTSSVKKYLAISCVADTWDIGNRTCRWNRYVSTNIFFLYTGVQVQWLELAVETKRFIVTPKKYPPHRFCWCWKCKVVCWRQLMTWFIARAVPKVQCIERSSAAVFQWFYFLMEGNKLTMNSYTAKKNMTKQIQVQNVSQNGSNFLKIHVCLASLNWQGRRGKAPPRTSSVPGTCLLAGIFCEEAGSWQEFSARKQVPGRKFVPGGRFLAEILCREALPCIFWFRNNLDLNERKTHFWQVWPHWFWFPCFEQGWRVGTFQPFPHVLHLYEHWD